MSTPDKQARDRDRDAAIEVVEAAWADGQIVEPDRDKRVEELLRAQTLAEIRMLTHDLQPPAAAPLLAPPVEYGPAVPSTTVPTRPVKVPRALFVVPIVVVVVVAISVVGGILALVGALDDNVLDGPTGSASEPDVLSERGYADLLAAIEDETGSTTAFMAVLYPTYAVVHLPVDATTLREEYWYWDGSDLTRNDSKGTSSFRRTDLGSVDAGVIVDLVQQARRLVEEPTTWYAIVRAPDDDRAVVWAYASNEYSETEYLGARRDGTVIYDSTQH